MPESKDLKSCSYFLYVDLFSAVGQLWFHRLESAKKKDQLKQIHSFYSQGVGIIN